MSSPESEVKHGAKSRYEELSSDRQQFLDRAREASRLTIPSLVPPEGHNGTSPLYKPYQSLGARGVNNLSARLLMTLFPTNQPFSRLRIDEAELKQEIDANPELKTELDEALSKAERKLQNEIETSGIRRTAFQILKNLVVSGNILTYTPPKGGLKAYGLSQYVVLRDHAGNLLEVILKETLAPASLPKAHQQYCVKTDSKEVLKSVDLYTHVKLCEDGSEWDAYQEVCDVIIQETIGTYKKELNPWNAIRWTEIQGENYGRGHIEDCYGDLQSLEGLTQAIVEGSAAAAKVLFLVNPNGTTTAKNIAKTPNGGFAEGSRDDVHCLQLEKFNDFRVAKETIADLSDRLNKAFLLNSSIQRSGERVTATEWRYMVEELETALGGVYAVLSQTFQLPLVTLIIANLQKQNKFPKFPKDSIRPQIVTGLEALGRSSDLNKLDQFVAEMGQLLGPEAIAKFVNPTEFLTRRATALGIDTKNLIRTREEIDAQDQANQQQQSLAQVAPQLIKSGADMINTNKKLGAQQAQPQPA